jgi:hypothetical protein
VPKEFICPIAGTVTRIMDKDSVSSLNLCVVSQTVQEGEYGDPGGISINKDLYVVRGDREV